MQSLRVAGLLEKLLENRTRLSRIARRVCGWESCLERCYCGASAGERRVDCSNPPSGGTFGRTAYGISPPFPFPPPLPSLCVCQDSVGTQCCQWTERAVAQHPCCCQHRSLDVWTSLESKRRRSVGVREGEGGHEVWGSGCASSFPSRCWRC